MPMVDWDWPAQLKGCQSKIAKLQAKITSQKAKIDRLLGQNLLAPSSASAFWQ